LKAPLSNTTLTRNAIKNVTRTLCLLLAFVPAFAVAQRGSSSQWGPKRNTTESAGPTAATWGSKRNATESAGPNSQSAAKDRSPTKAQEQPGGDRAVSNRQAPSVGQHTGTPIKKAGGAATPSVSQKPLFASSGGAHAAVSSSKSQHKKSPSTLGSSKRKHGMTAGRHDSGVHRHAKPSLHKPIPSRKRL
jgi:hypothetical protein